MAVSSLRVLLLGVVAVQVDEQRLTLGGAKQKALLAMLALNAGRVVPVSQLIDALWSEDPPDKALGTLQVHVAALRRLLRDAGHPQAVGGGRGGYSLSVAPNDVDALQFESLCTDADRAQSAGDLTAAEGLLRSALDLWRGPALADLADAPFARGEIGRLDELRLSAWEHWLDLQLQLGRTDSAVAELERLVVQHPLREGLWARLMLGLYRAGRQADALEAFQQARTTLENELGVEPSQALRELQTAVLRQDPALAHGLAAAVPAPNLKATVRKPVEELTGPAWLVAADRVEILQPGRSFVGRDPECEVVVSDEQASRRHAVVRGQVSGWAVTDLDSTNGTMVNDRRLEPQQPHRLDDGDVLVIGDCRFRFSLSRPD